MSFEKQQLKKIIEAALMASGQTLSIDQIMVLFLDDQQPERDAVKEALNEIAEDCESRGIELKQVSSGYRFQARQEYAPWISRLWEEKPPRYSRALLETLVLIAYRQPITRGEIEEVRGVTVSTHIIKTLLEREWVKVVGHRDVPGKPALYATTKAFLDYFNLKSLDELPTLAEIRDLDKINAELALDDTEFEQPEQDLDKMMGEDSEQEGDVEPAEDEVETIVADADNDTKVEESMQDMADDDTTTDDSTAETVTDTMASVSDDPAEDAGDDISEDTTSEDTTAETIEDVREEQQEESAAVSEDADEALETEEDALYAKDDDAVSMHEADDQSSRRQLIEQDDETGKAITEESNDTYVLNT